MSINLFEDVYCVRNQMLTGKSDGEQIYEFAESVEKSIADETASPKLRFLYLKITNYCNSDCEYCAHAVSRRNDEKKNDISTEVLYRVLREAADMKVDSVIFSGGEPLLREEIYDMISFCCENWMVPIILTNGTLLPETWERLGEAGLRYVIISMDSVNSEIYEKHRGIAFSKAEEGISSAVKMMEKYPGTEVHVSAVLEKDNFDSYFDLVDYMNARNIKVQISPLHDHFHIDNAVLDDERRTITEFTEKMLEYKKNGGLIASSEQFIEHLPAFFCDKKKIPDVFSCKVGYSSLFVDALMNARCCWSQELEPVGNIRDNSLSEIWNGEKMRNSRKLMLKCQCEGCWYMCTVENTIIVEEAGRHNGK